jgi:KaiC domain protein
MSEEDDWFERALRDLDEESDRSPEGEGDDAADGSSDETADEKSDEDDPFGDLHDETDETESGDTGDESDPFGGGSFGDEGDPFGGGSFGDEDDPFGAGATGDEGASETIGDDFVEPDFAEDDFDRPDSGGPDSSRTDGEASGSVGEADGADSDAPADGGESPFGSGSFGEDDPFGGYRGSASASSDDFGFGEFGEGEGDSGGGGDGGGGGVGGGPEGGFDVDPEEFESSIDRADIGIEGLDDMILGGVPSRSLLSVIGGAGTGKTTFALQFLNEALESDQKGVYITLEQTSESIYSTAEEKGWSFREAADEDRLAVVAIDPIEMANSLASIRNDLVRLIVEFDADRLVLDSVSLLEMMYDHPAKRRSEVFGFTRSLKDVGVTTLLTSEASRETPHASRHGIVEYLTDAVFVLQYVRGSDFRETRLAVEIQKIRDANHSRETKPYEITDTGISVYGQANIF